MYCKIVTWVYDEIMGQFGHIGVGSLKLAPGSLHLLYLKSYT